MGLQSPIQERIYRRLLLVGPGAASFYRDACRLMLPNQELEATTHLVSHLLREIESAMRGALAPIAEVSHAHTTPSPDGETAPQRSSRGKLKGDGAEKHARQIRAILKALSIRDDEPVAVAWLQLAGKENSYGLHSRAHRDSLVGPRPLDSAFRQFWVEIEAVLDRVLDRFEAKYLDCVKIVDELLCRESPAAADAAILRQHVPNNRKLLSYFLQRAGIEWLVPLHHGGFFSRLNWPWSEYLYRVAQSGNRAAQEWVTAIVLKAGGNEDQIVAFDLAKATLAMPPDLAAQLAARQSAWVDTQQNLDGLPPDKLGAMISHLSNGNEGESALQFARILLAVLPDPKPGRLHKGRSRMGEWHYRQVLEKNIPDLVTVAPAATLRVLCDLLRDAVEMDLGEIDPDHASDVSTVWRRAVEDNAQDLSIHVQGIKGLLVSAVRNTAERIVSDELVRIVDAVDLLEGYRWLIFRRIALHVTRRFPAAAGHLLVECLVDREDFANPYERRLLHEYALLLREQFKHLPGQQQETLLSWLHEGPDLDRIKQLYESNVAVFTDERAVLYRKQWQQNRLALIRDDLPPDWRARYDQLVAELGEPEHPEFQSYSSGVQWGPTSPINTSEIGSLSVEEVVARIASFHVAWTPSRDISKPTPDGLSRELSAAVSAAPERFVPGIEEFRALPPTYIRGLISGFDQAARQNRSFDWGPVLELCGWVVEQPRGGDGESASGVLDSFDADDVDRDWTRARSAVGHLLSSAFESKEREPSFEVRDLAWKALFPLTTDPEPDEEYESRYLEGSGPAHVSLNTIRGEALHAVVRYALWVRKRLKDLPDGDALVAQGFATMPEVRRVLDTHLDLNVEPSLAIRSVYGQWFPWLHLIDEKWAGANLPRIFLADEAHRRYWAAAWSVYVVFSAPYDNIFSVLQSEYARAVGRLADSDVNIERTESPDERLAEHLIVLYARGCISLDEVGNLMLRFFERADARLRAHAVKTAGGILAGEENVIPPEVIERLRRLWEVRLDVMRMVPNTNRAELSAFSSWFTSRKFDAGWTLAQLTTVLRLIGSLEDDFDVPECLAELAAHYPAEAVECLHLMIEGDKEGWHIHHWHDQAREILQAAKQSRDATVLEMVDDVVNRLGARGFLEFRDLLA